MNHNLSADRIRFVAELDPRGPVDEGLAVTLAYELPTDSAAALAELIHKRVARTRADAYDRGYREGQRR
ncbi:MAG: hypothetical protein ACRDWI_07845 [Jiangellaceae bacterium]